jgi:hypothetical protein
LAALIAAHEVALDLASLVATTVIEVKQSRKSAFGFAIFLLISVAIAVAFSWHFA